MTEKQRTPLTDEQRAGIVTDFLADLKFKQLEFKYGTTSNTIRRILTKAKVYKPRRKGPSDKPKLRMVGLHVDTEEYEAIQTRRKELGHISGSQYLRKLVTQDLEGRTDLKRILAWIDSYIAKAGNRLVDAGAKNGLRSLRADIESGREPL